VTSSSLTCFDDDADLGETAEAAVPVGCSGSFTVAMKRLDNGEARWRVSAVGGELGQSICVPLKLRKARVDDLRAAIVDEKVVRRTVASSEEYMKLRRR